MIYLPHRRKAFRNQGYVSQYPPSHTDVYVKATNRYLYFDQFWEYFATDPAKSLTGNRAYNEWLMYPKTVMRFHIDLGTAKIIKRIYYENHHTAGSSTNDGTKDFTFWGSNTASDFADLVYANDGTWTQITTAQTYFDQHVALDQADPKYILVTNTTAYKYYAFKFATSWGGPSIGVRRIELQSGS